MNKEKIQHNLSRAWAYMVSNREDLLVFSLTVFSIILIWLNVYIGEILLGALCGVYFHREVSRFIYNLRDLYSYAERSRTLVLLGLLLSLFILAPWFVITVVIVAAIRKFFLMNG